MQFPDSATTSQTLSSSSSASFISTSPAFSNTCPCSTPSLTHLSLSALNGFTFTATASSLKSQTVLLQIIHSDNLIYFGGLVAHCLALATHHIKFSVTFLVPKLDRGKLRPTGHERVQHATKVPGCN